jgi:streptogramin lyase
VRAHHLLLVISAVLSTSTLVQAQSGVALTGKVSAAGEAAMEGVLVSAKRDGGTITTTVATNADGIYSFPAERLGPGRYTLSIRAIGYRLDGPKSVEVGQQAATTDLSPVKAKALANQLSNAEWLESLPGDEKLKRALIDCVDCHTLQRIVQSTHDADEFIQVFHRMGNYTYNSSPTLPQVLPPGGATSYRPKLQPALEQQMAEYLASINLSNAESLNFPFKTFPRLTGRSTRVIITEYDLPRRDTQPHDVVVDGDGTVWYSDFDHQFIGEMDPTTGKVTDHPLPVMRPENPKGTLGLEFDPQGNLWLSGMHQSVLYKFERKTKQVTTYPFPKEWLTPTSQNSMVSPEHSDVDGKVWTNNQDTREHYRLDLATGKYENLGLTVDKDGKRLAAYGMPADLANNVYLLNFGGSNIGRRDAKTNEITSWNTLLPAARARRGRVDSENVLWFAEYGANAIGRFDPKTNGFKEWQLPTRWGNPYDVVKARNGEVWAGSMMTDRVARLDPATGNITEYQLPRPTNIRRVFVDDRSGRPILWVGSNHGASIVKVEPLD